MKAKSTLLLGLCLLMQACASRIEPGHVGIVVDLAGKDRGVQDYTIRTGWVFYAPWGTQIYEYPTYMQTYAFTANPKEGSPGDESVTFTDKNSVKINADISLSYQLDAAKIPSFYVKFRNDDVKDFTFGYLHNVVRTAFDTVGGKFTVEQIMGDNGPFLKGVQDEVASQVSGLGVQIQQLGFIGYPRPPQQITDSINSAQQAKYITQQKQNELQQAQAEAAKAVAAAQGQADSNKVLANSITPTLLQWQQIQLRYAELAVNDRWINRWNGQVPQVSTGGGSTPGMLLNIPTEK